MKEKIGQSNEFPFHQFLPLYNKQFSVRVLLNCFSVAMHTEIFPFYIHWLQITNQLAVRVKNVFGHVLSFVFCFFNESVIIGRSHSS